MKKLVIVTIITLLVAFSSQVIMAQSYMRWVDWSKFDYTPSSDEVAHIFNELSSNRIEAGKIYYLPSGISYKMRRPDLLLIYIRKVYRNIDPTIKNANDDQIYEILSKSTIETAGDDIPYSFRNYFIAKNGEVRFIGGPLKIGVPILVTEDGIPGLKPNCFNPLEIYTENSDPEYSRSAVVADSIKTKNGVSDTVYVVIQLESNEDLPKYRTTYCYWRGYWDYSYVWTYPVYYPYYYVGYSWGFYRPYWWHHGPIYFSNCNYYHPYYHGWYTYNYHHNYYGRYDNSWHHGYRNNYKSFDHNNYTSYNKRYSNKSNVRTSNSRNNYIQNSSRNSGNDVRSSNSNVRNNNSTNNSRINNSTNSVRNSTNNSSRTNNYVYQNNQNRQRNYSPSNSNNRGTSGYSPSRSSNGSNMNRNNVGNSRTSNSGGNRSTGSGGNRGRGR